LFIEFLERKMLIYVRVCAGSIRSRRFLMNAGILPLFAAILPIVVAVGVPSSAQSCSLLSRTATSTGSIRPFDYLPAVTPSATTTTTENSNGSWSQSAGEAVHDAEIAIEKAYDLAARDVENLALEGRVEAVLYEDKSTRGSDVQVTADNGTVTLRGHVPPEGRAQTVQKLVADVYGVKGVNNQLNYPRNRDAVTPPDTDSTGVAHPAYGDLALAERAPAH
jgi:osmotically-inducible protein OsmY